VKAWLEKSANDVEETSQHSGKSNFREEIETKLGAWLG